MKYIKSIKHTKYPQYIKHTKYPNYVKHTKDQKYINKIYQKYIKKRCPNYPLIIKLIIKFLRSKPTEKE